MKKLKARRPSKKATILTIVGLLILGVSAYSTYSVLAWRGYEESVRQILVRDRQLDAALKDTKLNWEQLSDRLDSYHKETLSASCEVPTFASWQQSLVPTWQDSVEKCRKGRNQSVRTATQLGEIVGYINFDRQVAGVLEPLSQAPETATADDWVDIYKSWQLAEQQLAELDVPAGAESVYNSAHQAVKTVAGAWQALIEAHKAEDSPRFMTKSSELIEAYGSLNDLEHAVASHLNRLLEKL